MSEIKAGQRWRFKPIEFEILDVGGGMSLVKVLNDINGNFNMSNLSIFNFGELVSEPKTKEEKLEEIVRNELDRYGCLSESDVKESTEEIMKKFKSLEGE